MPQKVIGPGAYVVIFMIGGVAVIFLLWVNVWLGVAAVASAAGLCFFNWLRH